MPFQVCDPREAATAGARVLESRMLPLSFPDKAAPTREQNRFPDAFGIELQGSLKKYRRASQEEGGVGGRPPHYKVGSGLVNSTQLCVHSWVVVGEPIGRSLAPSSQQCGSNTKPKAHSAPESGPGGGSGRSATLMLSQWAGVLPGSWPRPGRAGLP